MKKLIKKGFTIVELVIVIAVIAILAGVLIPTFSGIVDKANSSAALQTARSSLTNALNMSSTAQLAGKDDNGYHTIFLVDGYAFGYTGNQLEAIDYPGANKVAQLKQTNFNAFLLALNDVQVTAAKEAVAEVKYAAGDKVYFATAPTAAVTTGALGTDFFAESGTGHDVEYTVTAADTAITAIAKVAAQPAVKGSIKVNDNVAEIIKAATGVEVKNIVIEINAEGNYVYGSNTFYLNSDFAKGVVVVTKFSK